MRAEPARLGRRLILHIGAPKTGSTALQEFLAANQAELRARGILYPKAACRAGGHHDLAFLSSGGYPAWAAPQEQDLARLVRDICAECAPFDGSVILSSEDFYLLCGPENVAALVRALGYTPQSNVDILVYVRRQDEAQLSWFNQRVKAQGYAGTIADSIAETWSLWDYDSRLREWEAVFGIRHMTLRVYDDRDEVETDCRRDICDILGVAPERMVFGPARSNTKLNRSVLEFQRRLNRLPIAIIEKRRFHRQLMALCAQTDGTGIFDESASLSMAERRDLLRGYANGNREVARRYGRGGALFDEQMPIENAGDGGASILTTARLMKIVSWLLFDAQGKID